MVFATQPATTIVLDDNEHGGEHQMMWHGLILEPGVRFITSSNVFSGIWKAASWPAFIKFELVYCCRIRSRTR